MIVSGEAGATLSRIGICWVLPRPTETVSRKNEMIGGTEPLTVTVTTFEVIAPLVAVMPAVPFATPVTLPVTESTVATAAFADAYLKVPPAM